MSVASKLDANFECLPTETGKQSQGELKDFHYHHMDVAMQNAMQISAAL